MTDKEAMEELRHWMADNDPVLDGHLPNWVWNLTALVDNILCETGRL